METKQRTGFLAHVFDDRVRQHEGRNRPHLGPISQAERLRRRKQYELDASRYAFQHDWFSGNLRRFEYFLSPLKGADCQLLEIGTNEGRSAVWLMDNIAVSEGSRVTCVDLIDHPNRRGNIEATGAAHRVDFRQGMSRDVLPTLPRNHFDFIYVDGYHGRVEVLEDAVLSFRLAKVDAIIAFDDYTWKAEVADVDGAPKSAVDAFCSIYRNKIELLNKGRQVWVRKITH
jgi:predicted O-methyltransferase YrrM